MENKRKTLATLHLVLAIVALSAILLQFIDGLATICNIAIFVLPIVILVKGAGVQFSKAAAILMLVSSVLAGLGLVVAAAAMASYAYGGMSGGSALGTGGFGLILIVAAGIVRIVGIVFCFITYSKLNKANQLEEYKFSKVGSNSNLEKDVQAVKEDVKKEIEVAKEEVKKEVEEVKEEVKKDVEEVKEKIEEVISPKEETTVEEVKEVVEVEVVEEPVVEEVVEVTEDEVVETEVEGDKE